MPVVAALLGPLFIYTLVAAASESGNPELLVFLAIIGSSVCVFTVFSVLEFPCARLEVFTDGLGSRSPWRRRQFISWSEVQSASFSSTARSFVIRANNGSAIKGSFYLSGVRDLYAELARRLPASAWKQRCAAFESESV